MAETPSKVESMRKWVVDHKLRAVGCLWLTGISGSIAYNWSRPSMKTSVKIIHARLHAQALTLAALVGSAMVEYYDQKHGTSGPKKEENSYLALNQSGSSQLCVVPHSSMPIASNVDVATTSSVTLSAFRDTIHRADRNCAYSDVRQRWAQLHHMMLRESWEKWAAV
ncbi:hypothetical protein ABZP36_032828 [Zizania latifolia]